MSKVGGSWTSCVVWARWPARIASSGGDGVFVDVLEPGGVSVGNSVVLLSVIQERGLAIGGQTKNPVLDWGSSTVRRPGIVTGIGGSRGSFLVCSSAFSVTYRISNWPKEVSAAPSSTGLPVEEEEWEGGRMYNVVAWDAVRIAVVVNGGNFGGKLYVCVASLV